MAKSVKSKGVYLVVTAMAVVMIVVWVMVIQSLNISFVRGPSEVTFFVITYLQLSLLMGWMMLQIEQIHKRVTSIPRLERLWAVVGALIGPIICTNVLMLILPFGANFLAHKATTENFVYLTSEPYGRKSRGLVKLELVDNSGGKHLVTFDKVRIDKLALKCGDILITKGRSSFLGYVIDSEAKDAGNTKSCPQR